MYHGIDMAIKGSQVWLKFGISELLCFWTSITASSWQSVLSDIATEALKLQAVRVGFTSLILNIPDTNISNLIFFVTISQAWARRFNV